MELIGTTPQPNVRNVLTWDAAHFRWCICASWQTRAIFLLSVSSTKCLLSSSVAPQSVPNPQLKRIGTIVDVRLPPYSNDGILLLTLISYSGTDWENLPNTKPPDLLPYLPSTSNDREGLRSKYRVRGKNTCFHISNRPWISYDAYKRLCVLLEWELTILFRVKHWKLWLRLSADLTDYG